MTEVRTHPSFEKQKEQTRVANIKSQEKRIRTNERGREALSYEGDIDTRAKKK